MRFLILAAFVFSMLLPGFAVAAPGSAAGCQFVLGFAALHDAIPGVVGECVVDAHYDLVGDAHQETTASHGQGGLLYWRKADNWTGFTDGYNMWVVRPGGVEKRLNTERFAWEPDRLVGSLRNAEYRLPFGFDPRNPNAEATFRLTDGIYGNRAQRMHVQLQDSAVASGDLNGDGVPDAVANLIVSSGGSGIFEYAVAVVDKGGKPVQAGYELLGDRVKVNQFTIANGQITVDMIAQGPNDPMCCPTQRVVKTLGIQIPRAAARSLDGTSWRLQSYVGAAGKPTPVLVGSTVTADFGSGRLSGNAGCNSYTTTYKADAATLSVAGTIASTMMACASPAGVMDQETAFLRALAASSSYRIAANRLEVARADGTTILTFSR